MSFLQAAGLAVRLFSLWIFLYSFQALMVAYTLTGRAQAGTGTPLHALVLLTPGVVALALGILLWRFPLAVARLLVPRTSDTATTITLQEAWQLGSVMVGLLVLAHAGPLLLRALAFAYYSAGHDFGGPLPEQRATLVEAATKTLFGLFLVFGNRVIYRRFGAAG